MNFIANVCVSRKRKLHTLSTCFSDRMEAVEIEGLEHDETTIEDQDMLVTREETRPEVRNEYSRCMDLSDTANDCALEAVPAAKAFHWSTATMRWIILGALLANNAWKLYQCVTGNLDMTRRQWRGELINALVREEYGMHPLSVHMRGVKKLRCRSCAYRQKQTRTTWRCDVCGPICKYCEQGKDHENYVNASATRYRRFREEGARVVHQRWADVAMVSKLVIN